MNSHHGTDLLIEYFSCLSAHRHPRRLTTLKQSDPGAYLEEGITDTATGPFGRACKWPLPLAIRATGAVTAISSLLLQQVPTRYHHSPKWLHPWGRGAPWHAMAPVILTVSYPGYTTGLILSLWEAGLWWFIHTPLHSRDKYANVNPPVASSYLTT